MRTRSILLAALAVGLAVLGQAIAQPPPTQPSGMPAYVPVRPASEWTPTPAAPGYVPPQPAPPGNIYPPPNMSTGLPMPGSMPTPSRPRPSTAVAAGPDGVTPAGFLIPPPAMDLPALGAGSAIPSPGGSLIPPPPVMTLPPTTETKFGPGTPAVPPPPTTAVPTLPVPVSPAAPTTPAVPPVATAPTLPVIQPATPSSTPKPVPVSVATQTSAAPVKPAPLTSMPLVPPVPTNGTVPARAAHAVVLETEAPETVVFGQEFRYDIVVKNTGPSAVSQVRVEDEIPVGARYIGSEPPAEMTGDRLMWSIGTLASNAEKRITVRVKPTDEGEIHSRATVSVSGIADVRCKVTRPRVTVGITGPEVSRAGDEAAFSIKVTNTGSGPAAKMIIQARMSDGLVHQVGPMIELGYDVLPAGESKVIPLRVTGVKAGLQHCQVVVVAEGSPDATAKASVNVVEPLLQLKQDGPAKCLVRAEPVFDIELSNPGTAATDTIKMTAIVPEGFEYVSSTDAGAYSVDSRTVVWPIPALSPGSNRTVKLKLRAVAAGSGTIRTVAQSVPHAGPVTPAGAGGVTVRTTGHGLEARAETTVAAEGVAAIRFEVVGRDNPVEVGKEAVYDVRVVNQGTGPCTNVQMVAVLAEGTTLVGAGNGTSAATCKTEGQQVVFDPIPSLGVKADMVYTVRIRAANPGDLRFRVQLTCDQLRTPVAKEESTQFVKP